MCEVCPPYPFGERLFLFEGVPTEETALCVGLHDNGTVLQGAVGQEDVMVGTFHLLFVSSNSPGDATVWMDGVRVFLHHVNLALTRLALTHLQR